MLSQQLDFKIYPSLLDAFQTYLDSEKNWETFYDRGENPKITLDEFNEKAYKELIDKINRVPFKSDAADKGTAFNEIVDCIIENRKSSKFNIYTVVDKRCLPTVIRCETDDENKDKYFDFPIPLCKEFGAYYKGALTQQRVEAILPTRYGNVSLYGIIDELMPMSVHDIKTTSHYSSFKFRNHWQHFVYPYCLIKSGNDIHTFEYNITDFRNTYTETYVFDENRDIPILTDHVERFIEFLLSNKDKISDKKVFGGENDEQSDNR